MILNPEEVRVAEEEVSNITGVGSDLHPYFIRRVMDTKELSKLSKKYSDELAELGLTKAETIMLGALIQARLHQLPFKQVGSVQAVEEISRKVEKVTPLATEKPTKASDVPYDPMYDPPPPDVGDEPPPRDGAVGKILAPANKACVCNVCNKVVYITNRPVKDGCKVAEFIESFTPTEGMPKMSRKVEIMNIDGAISMDCPSCNGKKTLYLVGGK